MRGCLIFGQGKFQNGVLVEPKPEYMFDPRDEKKLEELGTSYGTERSGSSVRGVCTVPDSCYRPTIERANAIAPQHSRIFKEVCHYLYARTRYCIAQLRSR